MQERYELQMAVQNRLAHADDETERDGGLFLLDAVMLYWRILAFVCTVEPGFAKCQRSWDIGSLYRGFVISRFFSIHYTITGLKNIVRSTEDFVTYIDARSVPL